MRQVKVITFFLLASFFSMCNATAQDMHKKNDANTKHANVTCKNCHGSKMPTESPDTLATCVTCHGDYEKLAQATNNDDPNPHRTHFTDMPCGECHKIHSESTLQACTICHNMEMKVP